LPKGKRKISIKLCIPAYKMWGCQKDQCPPKLPTHLRKCENELFYCIHSWLYRNPILETGITIGGAYQGLGG